jgi:hypothetical protein
VPFAFNLNRFNVATSRAKFCTLLITDENINNFYPHIDDAVREYLNSIKDVNNFDDRSEIF